ncbi:MAG: molecular chaperone GroEL [Flavobacteriaceae bacterium]|nr:molecular chaperone GroEL [Flavobacteriaceae bacterium]|tara:strand:- start:3214 stop:4782 length:1569 start_codon:yes stop_codon:yes gene_type:complete
MSKHFSSEEELRDKLLQGVSVLADSVGSTLGPKGRNVIIRVKGKSPFVTKDGVTVAKHVDLEDPFEDAAAQIVKQASAKTNSEAGDGTTTSTVLASSIFTEAASQIDRGTNATELKRGMDKAVAEVIKELSERSRPISSKMDVCHIATLSANNDVTVGELVAEAVDKVGKNGSINIREAKSVDTTLDLVEGFRFDSGYAAGAFVTDERRKVASYEDPLFFLTDSKLERVDQILPSLEIAARESRPFIIIADEIEGQALAALIMNTIRGSMKVAAVKAPRYGEDRRNIMMDLALATGAKYFRKSEGHDISDAKLTDFGTARSIEIAKGMTTIVGAQGDLAKVEQHIENLKQEIVTEESIEECQRIQERITRLASGIAVISVGAHTEVEMIEKKHRIEDALEAVRSAQVEGVVPGGGVTLLRIADRLQVQTDNQDQAKGVEIIKKALSGPIIRMAENSGLDAKSVLDSIRGIESEESGMNFATGEVVDFFESGIIDPAKVTRCALQNAVSVAGTLITTNFAILE